MVEAAAPMEAAAPPPLPGKEILRGVLTALPGEDGSPPGATRATDAQYVAMSWRLAREFKLRGSGLLSRPQPPMTEGYRADGPLSGLRIPNLPEDAGEAARLWLLKHWQNPGAAKWLARADTVDRRERLSGALGLPHRSQPSCNLCFICRLAGEGGPPVHGLISQQATGDHSKTVAHGEALKLAQAAEAGVSAANTAAETAEKGGKERGEKQGKKQGRQQREEELRRSYGGGLLDVDRAGWERLLTHRQPKRARADQYRARRGMQEKGPLQPHEWAAPTTEATTRTRDEGEIEESHAGDVSNVATLEYEPGGRDEDIRARNVQLSARESAEHWRRLGIAENDIDVITGNPVEDDEPVVHRQQARRSVEDDEPVVFDYS
jgi:hypothetical protein